MTKLYTSHVGNNSVLISEIAALYLQDGDKIADVTYGKGVFWRKIDLDKYEFKKSDVITCPETPYDFRKLPYEDEEFDVVVLDPPYVHNPGKLMVDKNYQNAATTKGFYHKDIINLYREGMVEAKRILKEGGLLWVKCMDQVESGYQRWSHVELYQEAIKLGLYGKDLFVLTQVSKPHIQHQNQKHGRKNHSFLWVFKKPLKKELKSLKRYSIFKDSDQNGKKED
jgi:DNA modification methylase